MTKENLVVFAMFATLIGGIVAGGFIGKEIFKKLETKQKIK